MRNLPTGMPGSCNMNAVTRLDNAAAIKLSKPLAPLT